MSLIDQRDNTDCLIPGRFNLPSITAMFGEGSLDHPFEAPWANLLTSRQHSNLATGLLQSAWSHLTINFQEFTTTEQLADPTTYLLTQDVNRAGFYSDGSYAPSITKAMTIELEKAGSIDLGQRITTTLTRDDYERWSWEGCSPMSAVFLHLPHLTDLDTLNVNRKWTSSLLLKQSTVRDLYNVLVYRGSSRIFSLARFSAHDSLPICL